MTTCAPTYGSRQERTDKGSAFGLNMWIPGLDHFLSLDSCVRLYIALNPGFSARDLRHAASSWLPMTTAIEGVNAGLNEDRRISRTAAINQALSGIQVWHSWNGDTRHYRLRPDPKIRLTVYSQLVQARGLSRKARTLASGHIARFVSARIVKVGGLGLGSWAPAWDIVDLADRALNDALNRWESEPRFGAEEAVELAAGSLVSAWRVAGRLHREFRRRLQPKPSRVRS